MRWLAVARPTRVYLLDFFCSCIQFYVLLSLYLCFISFLYFDLYVLGDDAWISYGTFMQTRHLCVLIHIWTKDEVGLCPPGKYFYWLFQHRTSFVDHLCYLSCFRVCSLLPFGHLLGKGSPLGSSLWCLYVFCHFQMWYPGSGVVLDCIDSWSFPSFLLCNKSPYLLWCRII